MTFGDVRNIGASYKDTLERDENNSHSKILQVRKTLLKAMEILKHHSEGKQGVELPPTWDRWKNSQSGDVGRKTF